MIEFLISVEGIACIAVSLLIIAGGINELVYFNGVCRRTKKGYDNLSKDLKSL